MKKIAIGCLLLALLFGGYGLYATLTRVKTIPPELIGVWVSDAPGYGDRYMEFEKERLTIGTGAESIELNFIEEVRAREGREGTRYHIRYRNVRRLPLQLMLLYRPDRGGSFTIRHLEEVVWRRKKSAD